MGKLLKRPLELHEVMRWCEIYFQATGEWPTRQSGPVLCAPFETWQAVDSALYEGTRGLPGGQTLALLLQEKKQRRHVRNLPPLSEQIITAWAMKHHESYGRWPTVRSGVIPGS